MRTLHYVNVQQEIEESEHTKNYVIQDMADLCSWLFTNIKVSQCLVNLQTKQDKWGKNLLEQCRTHFK
jgi:hypothetical protein